MKIRKPFITLLLVGGSLLSVQANPGNSIDPKLVPLTQEQVNEMLTRVDEIRNMDKKNLSKTDRRKLRRELRTIKHQVAEAHTHGGIYISAGAIIIILLLIILL